jgi:hypothetical protein
MAMALTAMYINATLNARRLLSAAGYMGEFLQ